MSLSNSLTICAALAAAFAAMSLAGAADEKASENDAGAAGKVRTPVFVKPSAEYAVTGTVTTSDGKSVSGEIYTRLGMPLTIFERENRRFRDFALADVSRIDSSVEEEHDEPYWYWKQSGSDEKVYTGKTYPVQKYVTTVTLADGKKITGDLAEPLYLKDEKGKETRYILYKTRKGGEGQKLADLVYVKSIVVSGKGAGDAQESKETPAGSTDSKLGK